MTNHTSIKYTYPDISGEYQCYSVNGLEILEDYEGMTYNVSSDDGFNKFRINQELIFELIYVYIEII